MSQHPTCYFLVLCTNHYLPLGIRLAKKLHLFWRDLNVKKEVILCTHQDPKPFMGDFPFLWQPTTTRSWVESTNSKWDCLIQFIERHMGNDSIFYLDADTDLHKPLKFADFEGDTVGAQHFGDQSWMKDTKGFERNKRSKAYVPFDTKLPQMYYQGAFFGGTMSKVLSMLYTLKGWKAEDKSWGFEPGVNDESYLNCLFHHHPPARTILTKDFPFVISDKGGIKNPRQMGQRFDEEGLLAHAQVPIAIREGKVHPYLPVM